MVKSQTAMVPHTTVTQQRDKTTSFHVQNSCVLRNFCALGNLSVPLRNHLYSALQNFTLCLETLRCAEKLHIVLKKFTACSKTILQYKSSFGAVKTVQHSVIRVLCGVLTFRLHTDF